MMRWDSSWRGRAGIRRLVAGGSAGLCRPSPRPPRIPAPRPGGSAPCHKTHSARLHVCICAASKTTAAPRRSLHRPGYATFFFCSISIPYSGETWTSTFSFLCLLNASSDPRQFEADSAKGETVPGKLRWATKLRYGLLLTDGYLAQVEPGPVISCCAGSTGPSWAWAACFLAGGTHAGFATLLRFHIPSTSSSAKFLLAS